MHLFYEPEDDVRLFSGDCFVSKPKESGAYTLGAACKKSKFAAIRPAGRGGHFVVGKPGARAVPYLLGRPPARAGESAEEGVYVLQKADGTVYVGKSKNVEERLRQHSEGTGALCAKGKYRRVAPMTEPSEDLEAWERSEVLARMRKHGLGRVRGWMYTSKELTDQQREHAFSQVCERFDLCRRCGLKGHFVADCRRGHAELPDWACK